MRLVMRVLIGAMVAMALGCSKQESATEQPGGGGDVTGDFRMVVEDVFEIEGRGIVLTGTVASGTVKVGDTVVHDRGGVILASLMISGIERFNEELTTAQAGDEVGLRVDVAGKSAVQRDDVLRKTAD